MHHFYKHNWNFPVCQSMKSVYYWKMFFRYCFMKTKSNNSSIWVAKILLFIVLTVISPVTICCIKTDVLLRLVFSFRLLLSTCWHWIIQKLYIFVICQPYHHQDRSFDCCLCSRRSWSSPKSIYSTWRAYKISTVAT